MCLLTDVHKSEAQEQAKSNHCKYLFFAQQLVFSLQSELSFRLARHRPRNLAHFTVKIVEI